MKTLFLLAIFTFFLNFSSQRLQEQAVVHVDNTISIPSANKLQEISFGYQKAISHFLWFRTISYFGEHYRGDKNYTSLYKMCDLITELNSDAQYIYEFCALALAWEAAKPFDAIKILDKSIQYHPNNWQSYYTRGSINAFLLNDSQKAKTDFTKAASIDGAPEFINELLTRELSGTPNTLKFLKEAMRNANTQLERQILENYYNKQLQIYRNKALRVHY